MKLLFSLCDMTYNHIQKVRILYKTILKLHKGLPEELQLLGTNYVRDEFKRHKKVDSKEADIFFGEWTVIFEYFFGNNNYIIGFQKYALNLAKQLQLQGIQSGEKLGAPINEEVIKHMRDEQIAQLYELMKETRQNE